MSSRAIVISKFYGISGPVKPILWPPLVWAVIVHWLPNPPYDLVLTPKLLNGLSYADKVIRCRSVNYISLEMTSISNTNNYFKIFRFVFYYFANRIKWFLDFEIWTIQSYGRNKMIILKYLTIFIIYLLPSNLNSSSSSSCRELTFVNNLVFTFYSGNSQIRVVQQSQDKVWKYKTNVNWCYTMIFYHPKISGNFLFFIKIVYP